jgi:putative SOS response-associated peptidase YedK
MCGRYANFLDEQDLLDDFAVVEAAQDARLLPPSWNVGPMQLAPIVTLTPVGEDPASSRHRRLIAARWGLVPAWAKDASAGATMFNARSETVAEKPSFRAAFAQRRCLVPASGYYEWQSRAGGKQPYFIFPADESPLAFAGLWETRKDSDARTFTFSILTTAARGELAAIHDRQPVMLRASERDAWMDADTSAEELSAVIGSPTPAMATRPVGKAVGKIRNDDPSLVAAVQDPTEA